MFKNQIYHAKRSRRYDAKEFGISGRICDSGDAELCNISIGGASFMLTEPLATRTPCTVEISAGGEKFNISGQVVWARNPGEKNLENESREGKYTVGVIFINTYQNDVGSRLGKLLDKMCALQSEEMRSR